MPLGKWDARFLEMAFLAATWSKDPSTQVGCLIASPHNRVISLGFNGYPKGVHDAFTTREDKLLRTLHAEDNALSFANTSVEGCTAYITHPPCANCAARLIQRGIARVVFPCPDAHFMFRWGSSYLMSLQLFNEAGVALEVVT